MLYSWRDRQLTLHSAHSQLLEETQISLLSEHTERCTSLKRLPTSLLALCLEILGLENILPLCFHTPRKSPSCFQMQPIVNGSMSNCGISHSIPCFPELQFPSPDSHWWVWWAYETNFISFSPIRNFHCTVEHTSGFYWCLISLLGPRTHSFCFTVMMLQDKTDHMWWRRATTQTPFKAFANSTV